MADLRVQLGSLTLKHPVLPGPGPNVAGLADGVAALDGGAAALVLRTVTVAPPGGRSTWAAYGKDGALHEAAPSTMPFDAWLDSVWGPAVTAARTARAPLIPSIGYTPDEVAYMAERLPEADALLYDTHHAARGDLAAALQAIRNVSAAPVIVRLAPHHGEDLADLAAELEPHADAFCLIGSFGPTLMINADSPAGSPGIGFLSGAPIRPIAQRFVFEVAQRVAKPVIAAGGIFTGRDVVTALMLGASAVMVSTAAVVKGSSVYGEIAAELDQWLTGHDRASALDVQRAYIRRWGHGQRVVTEKEEAPVLSEPDCITCTFCETVCFYDAIKAPAKTLPTIDGDPCFQCGLCVSACPTGALSFAPREQVTLVRKGR
jgi:dihydroorotate dehydrogenase (NAD+) catalytic subunit